MEKRIWAGGRWLRCGYTTGACAAAAAKAAALLLLGGDETPAVTISLADGSPLCLELAQQWHDEKSARVAVKKDSGDDPDITDGVLVFATVSFQESGISIEGGEGVGRVTKPGLDQPVGQAAINSGPRRMIGHELAEVMAETGYTGGLAVEISIPGGEALAERTFNSRLGIEGGLSVLGSTGMVEPMSEAALLQSIKAELAVLAAAGNRELLLTPGNYGETYCREIAGLRLDKHIKCSNFIADSIEAAVEHGFSRILLVGHIGKLVKLGMGMRNTHSRHGDGRMPMLLMCALKAAAPQQVLAQVAESISSEAALLLLQEAGLLKETMDELGRLIDETLRSWAGPKTEIGFISFGRLPGLPNTLFCSDNASSLAKIWKE